MFKTLNKRLQTVGRPIYFMSLMYKKTAILVGLSVGINCFAGEVVVEPGEDLGTIIQQASPGDVVTLKDGVYSGSIKLEGIKGPLTIRAAEGEQPILDGTVPLPVEGGWKKGENGIWTVKLSQDIWQLFDGREMLQTARWPDRFIGDEHFWNQKASYRKMADGSSFGVVVDERPLSGVNEQGKLVQDEGALSQGRIIPDDVNTQTLAETGISMNGAIAILNIGSWMTWAQTVESHEAGSNRFTYSTDFSNQGEPAHWNKGIQRTAQDPAMIKKNYALGQAHYMLEGLPCLNRPGEYWYEKATKTLYLIPPQGSTPGEMNLRGKVLTYVLELENCSRLTFDGIGFFGGTFKGQECSEITIKNARFDYPTWSRRMLGELGRVSPTLFTRRAKNEAASNNRLINCMFHTLDGPALRLEHEKGDVLDNVLIHDADYSCMGRGLTVDLERSSEILLKRATIFNTGSGQCVKVGTHTRITQGHFFDICAFQSDGTAIQVGEFDQVEFDHNWSHDHGKLSYRFDGGGGPPAKPSQNGTMHHNVGWKCGQMQIKGDKQLIHNNTLWETPGMCTLLWEKMNGFHLETIVVNNLSPRYMTRWWGKEPPFPGIKHHNFFEPDAGQHLRDPENRDFRPKQGSPLVDAGTLADMNRFTYYRKPHYVGRAPDIGAYEFGDSSYWIPGFQHPHASTPVPPDGAMTVKPDADLMFLGGYTATAHRIWVGRSPHDLKPMAELSRNIFSPPRLLEGKTYYWRVDALSEDGSVEPGAVWKFTVE
ncbi:hypothetical protein PDESU_05473 [Pontiella desulfatans]|uniref:Right handed beta helix domain-containing protein n=1 Tax=Pontiella desulfatans TaxID=2750659 RepID=A0A6C2UBR6_PONDE|nr:hypothetical protein [Pontiella desulfatans]VGO16881.1 hypothetical protein PDESU_05473 [Pontiella desulfatans]